MAVCPLHDQDAYVSQRYGLTHNQISVLGDDVGFLMKHNAAHGEPLKHLVLLDVGERLEPDTDLRMDVLIQGLGTKDA